MGISRIDITDFRNLTSVKIEPLAHGFNFIYGHNGSGKTSLLEAIYYLSLGRSFRSSVQNRIICNSADKFSLFAHVLAAQTNQTIPIGIERHQGGDAKIRISGKDVRSNAELANLTPVQLINSTCFNLLDAPIFRRKYLDWGAFYQSNDFFRLWRQYERALKQRNAALRGQLPRRELDIWTQELIENATQLNQIRSEYVQNLLPVFGKMIDEILQIKNLEIGFLPGWNESKKYQEILVESIDKDRQLGYTQYGPHRADFKINVNRTPAKDILSRGQQKLFVCAMLLAQGTLLHNYTNKRPIYLIDDLPAELDIISRSNLMSLLAKQEAQIFVTAVERETLDGLINSNAMKMFHVEHGDIKEVT